MGNDQLYSDHIHEAIVNIKTFVAGMTYEQFMNDKKTYSAVLRELIVIGEAAKRLSEKFRQSHNTIPWHDVSGFRDKAVHDYAELNAAYIWETITRDLPLLERELGK
ncbi:hypothetical protein A3I40_01230 [Candidatus Uhrbacteria bacterium RIFCSPLOWO2_02_FULL_48_12]|uniref:DUF86 domain-containing protein n=1 Tax=Candidatus Uhrbacteria bacterium RIFCSPLOWO2_02_FULL_48_12 TaxID=1802407 RepID=A0A1F7VB16_9BACT|nr:MAG: hypothetical protein A3I40_01230 [Candidatus Uhrbacteria bacterium RIFCSPLOWO2_02_FULL_48_12]